MNCKPEPVTSSPRLSVPSPQNKQPVVLPDLRSLGADQSVILVADDEALTRNLVTLLMQQDGYFVPSAADGH